MIALALIPLLSLLNHLGGQSVRIPDPRIVCRVVLMPLAIGAIALLSGMPVQKCYLLAALCFAGFAIWAIPAWGEMFMSVNGQDNRDYTKHKWITELVDFICVTSKLTPMSPARCKEWGMVYGIIRGGFMYPMFLEIAYLFTPWAAAIGLVCFLQGIVYRLSSQVLYAEYVFGALIGASFSGILFLS